jgi:hypothetical protein
MTGTQGNADFMLKCYLSNGSIDAGFGTNGTVLTDFPTAIPEGSDDVSYCMLLTPEGKMVVAGTASGSVALVRYNGMTGTAVNDPSLHKTNLSVYPNPFNDVLNLRMNNISGPLPVTITVINMLGQQLFSTKTILKAANTTVTLPNLIAGNYILSVAENT